MKHFVEIYFAGVNGVYAACNTCKWRGPIVTTVYEAEQSRTDHNDRVSSGFLGIRTLLFYIKAWRYGYKKCPCRSACSVCNGFGFIPTKGCQKFSKELTS